MVQAVIPTTVTGLQGHPVATTAPTTNQALAWNGSAWAPAGPYLTAAGAPYVAINYVDNSGFIINQRNYASGAALAAGAYGIDRWKAGASGCTLTFTSSPASTVVTIAAGTLQQVIEGVGQINSSYTLSWLGSATGRVNTGAYTASPISFTGAPNTNVTIEFQGGTFGQAQLQLGTQATQWQPLPAALEFVRCQRFYQYAPFAIGGWSGFSSASALTVSSMPLMVVMRASPTVVLTNLGLAGTASSFTASANNYSFGGTLNVIAGTSAYLVSGDYALSADL